MVTLRLNNRRVRVQGASRSLIRKLEKATSYKVDGAHFAPSFKAGRWDGREHLLTFSTKHGYSAPSGLAPDIAQVLKDEGEPFRVVYEQKLRTKRRRLIWNHEIVLRGYQEEAVAALLARPIPGCGILKMPIRSGKTKTAARVIWKLGLPTLFIVPSKMLLHQTRAALDEALPGTDVGIIGDSEYNPGFVTVATIQTLAQMRGKRASGGKKGRPTDPRYRELIASYDVMIADEAHHIRGGGDWHKVFADVDARFKVGLSATAFLEDDKENGRGIIWLKACCGPIRIDVPSSRLVEEGYLMAQNVRMLRITRPDMNGRRWSATLRAKCITRNKYRNRKIAQAARHYADRGLRVIIIARFRDHIALLSEELDSLGVDYRTITGSDAMSRREEVVEGLVDGDYNVVIGSVLGEGVDIPSVDVVINAEGGSDVKATIQRQRNLTISAGKSKAILIDFMDLTNAYFEKHSKARLATYRSEPSFNVRVI